jgi:small GTP-binding protein
MCDCGGGGGSSTSDNLSPSQSQLTNRINRRGTDPVVHTVGGSMKATDVSRLEQKCVLVGNVAVGKSSIVNRYTRGEYLAQYQATIGAAFVPKEVSLEQGKSIKLQIWDTAGEEKYRAMTQFYYRKAAAGVVVFGLDDRQSFNGIKGWIDELREAQPNVIILVAGNKSDIDPDDRAIGEEEIEDLVDELGVCYMEVSALDGSNVDMLFLEVAQNIYDNPDAWATA